MNIREKQVSVNRNYKSVSTVIYNFLKMAKFKLFSLLFKALTKINGPDEEEENLLNNFRTINLNY